MCNAMFDQHSASVVLIIQGCVFFKAEGDFKGIYKVVR